jgi:DUF4097 and DUF4098 domain-containing protein YvlB
VPDFATPEPISAVIDLVMGDVRIAAGDRHNTVVEVRPRDPGRRADAAAAEEARVEYDAGRLLIKTTRRWRSYSPFSDGGSVDVHVQLPTGSRVTGTGEMTAFRCTGSLGDCRLKTAFGDIQVDGAARVELTTSAGDISVGRATGHAEISTGTGALQIDALEDSGVVKNSNGDSHVGEATGDLRVKAANGDIAIDRSRASVVAKTANGDIRIGGACRGSIVAETGLGAVEIAIADGTAAWLDLDTKYGHLHNTLDAAGPPGPGDGTVEVRGRTAYGDITIRRSDPPAPVAPTA